MAEIRKVQILGAKPIDDRPVEILDRRSPPAEPPNVEVVQHDEIIIEDERKLRREKRDPTAPEVRVRHNDGGFQKAVENDD
jgi:hypothetical protein